MIGLKRRFCGANLSNIEGIEGTLQALVVIQNRIKKLTSPFLIWSKLESRASFIKYYDLSGWLTTTTTSLSIILDDMSRPLLLFSPYLAWDTHSISTNRDILWLITTKLSLLTESWRWHNAQLHPKTTKLVIILLIKFTLCLSYKILKRILCVHNTLLESFETDSMTCVTYWLCDNSITEYCLMKSTKGELKVYLRRDT